MASSNLLSDFVQQLKNHPIVIIVGFVVLVGGGALTAQRYLERAVDPDAVALRLASDSEFVKFLSAKLEQNPIFVEQVRGERGPKGDSGERGPAGDPPNIDSIVNSLAASDSFLEAVSDLLTEEHNERLRGMMGPQGLKGPPGPPGPVGPPGQPGPISLSGSEVQQVVSVLMLNNEFVNEVAKSLMGPIKPMVMEIQDPGGISCRTVCNLEFGDADCRGGVVKTILETNEEVSCGSKVFSGEILSCYCTPPPTSR